MLKMVEKCTRKTKGNCIALFSFIKLSIFLVLHNILHKHTENKFGYGADYEGALRASIQVL